jgi:hypothetical protein
VQWIDKNFNKKGTTSYIGAVLLEEGFAERINNKAEIKFI